MSTLRTASAVLLACLFLLAACGQSSEEEVLHHRIRSLEDTIRTKKQIIKQLKKSNASLKNVLAKKEQEVNLNKQTPAIASAAHNQCQQKLKNAQYDLTQTQKERDTYKLKLRTAEKKLQGYEQMVQ